MALPPEETAALLAHYESYARAWAANDAAAIMAHWAPDRFNTYKAEEIGRFFWAWDDVVAYLRQNERFHETVRLAFEAPTFARLSEDIVTVGFAMRWDIKFAANAAWPDGALFAHRGKAMGGNNHVLSMTVSTTAGWRLIAWSETPDAPITYMTQLYYRNVTPGFG